MTDTSVVVTGMGCISAAGLGSEALWRACVDDRPLAKVVGPASAGLSLPSLAVPMAVVSDDVVGGAVARLDASLVKRPTRHVRCALTAVVDLTDGLGHALDGRRAGVIWGSGTSTLRPIEEGYEALFLAGKARVSPLTVPNSMVSAPAGAIARALGLKGVSFSVGSACGSSAHAIATGAALVAAGTLEGAIVGGSEVLRDHGAIAAWMSTGVVSKTTCRPFQADRDGILLGEGAAALLLEREDRARASGRPVLARLRCCAYSTGEVELMSPDPAAVLDVMRQVRAALRPQDVVVMNCHATGTRAGDAVEAAAINEAFRDYEGELRISHTKATTGHTMSAAGAIEAVVSIANLHADEAIAIDARCGPLLDERFLRPLTRRPDVAVSNSFGFGGMNCALVFERP